MSSYPGAQADGASVVIFRDGQPSALQATPLMAGHGAPTQVRSLEPPKWLDQPPER